MKFRVHFTYKGRVRHVCSKSVLSRTHLMIYPFVSNDYGVRRHFEITACEYKIVKCPLISVLLRLNV